MSPHASRSAICGVEVSLEVRAPAAALHAQQMGAGGCSEAPLRGRLHGCQPRSASLEPPARIRRWVGRGDVVVVGGWGGCGGPARNQNFTENGGAGVGTAADAQPEAHTN